MNPSIIVKIVGVDSATITLPITEILKLGYSAPEIFFIGKIKR